MTAVGRDAVHLLVQISAFLMLRPRFALVFLVATLVASCGDEASSPSSGIGDVGADGAPDADAAGDAEGDTTSDAGGDGLDAGSSEDATSNWGASCTSDADCTAPADYCVLQPGESTGYCGARCANSDACVELGAPAGWTCNTVEFLGCDDASTNWCAPPEELTENAAFLIECTE